MWRISKSLYEFSPVSAFAAVCSARTSRNEPVQHVCAWVGVWQAVVGVGARTEELVLQRPENNKNGSLVEMSLLS